MHAALHAVFVILGAVVVVATLGSAIRSTILPRAVPVRLARLTTLAMRVVFRVRVGRRASYERRDRIMALFGPVSLLGLLTTWLLSVFFAYALIYYGAEHHGVRQALELSGSSLFTLGTTPAPGLGGSAITYTEAGIGLVLLTLLITYLPSIYSAFSRRERGVGLLKVRAGNPPTAPTMLIRYSRIEDSQMRLNTLWQTWEEWFVELEESHTTFPILAFFRSPLPEQSWIISAGVVLDSASLWVAAIEHPKDPDAQLCIRAGFQALRRIADSWDVRYDADPSPADPITISRSEWEEALDELAAEGIPIVADRDAAWLAWKGWRVNYDTVVLNLARLIEAPVAPWVSDRSPLRGAWSLRSVLLTRRPSTANEQS
jgi:hypothetical protein